MPADVFAIAEYVLDVSEMLVTLDPHEPESLPVLLGYDALGDYTVACRCVTPEQLMEIGALTMVALPSTVGLVYAASGWSRQVGDDEDWPTSTAQDLGEAYDRGDPDIGRILIACACGPWPACAVAMRTAHPDGTWCHVPDPNGYGGRVPTDLGVAVRSSAELRRAAAQQAPGLARWPAAVAHRAPGLGSQALVMHYVSHCTDAGIDVALPRDDHLGLLAMWN